MDLTVIGGAISGLKTATDIAKGLVGINTTVEVNAKALELQRALLSAYGDALSAKETQSALTDEIRELKRQLSNNEEFAADMKRYKLDTPWPGSVVYALKESMSNGEPAHYLCANCAQRKQKSILQCVPSIQNFTAFACPNCRASVTTRFKGGVSANYASPEAGT
jgi:DNA-directed RNA polymerase subunit RPC12/RpoP